MQAAVQRQPLGKLLIARGIIAPGQLELALDEQRRSNRQNLLGEILVRQRICSQEQVSEALAVADDIPFARVGPHLADPKAVALLPYELLRRKNALPLFLVEGMLTVAIAEPADVFLIEELEHRSGCRVQVVAATARDIQATLDAYLPAEKIFVDPAANGQEGAVTLVASKAGARSAVAQPEPAVLRLIESFISAATHRRATEVHLEPGESELRIRFRVDGCLMEHLRAPQRLAAPIAHYLRQLAGIIVGSDPQPQRGRLRACRNNHQYVITVNCISTLHGQRLILQIAQENSSPLKLEKLGFSYDTLKQWRKALSARSGLMIVAGPAGSGKRAVLYSAIQERNAPETNLCTIEHPIERDIAGITQIQVDPAMGLSFTNALHAALAQQPDVMMLSDLPDGQTATEAACAALGGKLVLGAMHAADAASAIWRLVHVGVDANLLASTLTAVLGRRLVRRLCLHCRQARDASASERRQLMEGSGAALTLFHPRGCEHCQHTGYHGSLGIHELLLLDDQFRERLSANPSLPEIRQAVAERGIKSLRLDGVEKVRNGVTTLEEVLRAIS